MGCRSSECLEGYRFIKGVVLQTVSKNIESFSGWICQAYRTESGLLAWLDVCCSKKFECAGGDCRGRQIGLGDNTTVMDNTSRSDSATVVVILKFYHHRLASYRSEKQHGDITRPTINNTSVLFILANALVRHCSKP